MKSTLEEGGKCTHKYKMKTAEKINKSKTLEVRGLEHRLLHPDWQKKDNNFPVSGMRGMSCHNYLLFTSKVFFVVVVLGFVVVV